MKQTHRYERASVAVSALALTLGMTACGQANHATTVREDVVIPKEIEANAETLTAQEATLLECLGSLVVADQMTDRLSNTNETLTACS